MTREQALEAALQIAEKAFAIIGRVARETGDAGREEFALQHRDGCRSALAIPPDHFVDTNKKVNADMLAALKFIEARAALGSHIHAAAKAAIVRAGEGWAVKIVHSTDRIGKLEATVVAIPRAGDAPELVARIARLWAELHEYDRNLAIELANKLPTMEIHRK